MGLSFEHTNTSYGHRRRRNKTFNWLGSDTEEAYKGNVLHPTRRKLLQKYDWVDAKIDYTLNEFGFRCQEFDYGDSIMFLGCSFTVGIGVDVKNSFPYHVAKELKLINYNLGICGATGASVFKAGYHWIPKLRPKIVVYAKHEVDAGRYFEYFESTGKRHQISPADVTHPHRAFYEEWISNNINITLRDVKTKLALESLCRDVNAKFINFDIYSYEHEKDIIRKNNHDPDLARDLGHYGRKTNRFIADYVLQQIDSTKN